MIKKLIILQFIFKFTCCLEIRYQLTSGEVKQLKIESTSILSPEILSQDLQAIQALKYKEDEIQIETISDFPHLENVSMVSTNQLYIPSFKSVPKLYMIDFYANEIVFVKKESFSATSVKVLELSGNQISVIENKSFGSSVTEVVLVCNNLRIFSAKWFQNPSILEKLDMTSNYLKKIDPYGFKNFPKLHDIKLSNNVISSIGEGAFSSRNNFSYLELAANNLTQLNSNSFVNENFNIAYFNVENNNLTYLDPDLLKKMNVSKKFNVGHNPWQCSCWNVIKEWVHDDSVLHRNQSIAACVAAKSFSSICIPYVDYEIIEHYRINVELPVEINRENICNAYKLLYFLSIVVKIIK